MKLKDLPLPRLQLTWEHAGESEWHCNYDLLIPLAKYDIRNNGPEPDYEVGGGPGYTKARIGQTKVTSIHGPIKPEYEGGQCTGETYLDTPFRDGAHAAWDSFTLGIPAFVVYEERVKAIEPRCPLRLSTPNM